jgi:lysophospholipid acyltransferase (LPLAT)-like uncharacterized protein
MAGLLAGFLYNCYAATFRYELQFEDEADRRRMYQDIGTPGPHPGQNLIYACFHQDDLNTLPYFSRNNLCVLISRSKDGQILASAVEYLGYQTVRGSSHRGGIAGLLALVNRMKDGYSTVIAVDGPKGPIYKVKEGAAMISAKMKRPIVPVRTFPAWKHVFEKSWNKATVPLPFSKVTIVVGKIDFYSTQGLEDKLLALRVRG